MVDLVFLLSFPVLPAPDVLRRLEYCRLDLDLALKNYERLLRCLFLVGSNSSNAVSIYDEKLSIARKNYDFLLANL